MSTTFYVGTETTDSVDALKAAMKWIVGYCEADESYGVYAPSSETWVSIGHQDVHAATDALWKMRVKATKENWKPV